MTFSGTPKWVDTSGLKTLNSKYEKVLGQDWGMNTNIHAAFKEILKVAKKNDVPQSDMPEFLLILSDMEFDSCVTDGSRRVTGFDALRSEYASAGYKLPTVVFWQIHARNEQSPVRFDQRGAVLLSGYSPALLEAIATGDMSDITPESLAMKVLMKPRYDAVSEALHS